MNLYQGWIFLDMNGSSKIGYISLTCIIIIYQDWIWPDRMGIQRLDSSLTCIIIIHQDWIWLDGMGIQRLDSSLTCISETFFRPQWTWNSLSRHYYHGSWQSFDDSLRLSGSFSSSYFSCVCWLRIADTEVIARLVEVVNRTPMSILTY